MSAGARWQVDDYRGPKGTRPVKAFLDGLDDDPRAKAYAALELLAQMGNTLRFPKSRALGDGLFELRVSFNDGTMRLIYEYRPGRRISLLHAFAKKTQQTPREDLALAKSRMCG